MDILRNIFGSFTSGIIRLAVTAGILALCYFFIVKPVLKTTDDAIKSSGLDQIGKTLKDLGPKIEHQVTHSFKVTKTHGGSTQKLLHCIQHANQNVDRIHRCTVKF